ncbi:Transcriptional regulator containing GAF, AAA-type ATPase, and DNA-binding Fis domains [Desulfonatronum thiosulfatophilum]|uniref:Transcriptional regulator containing GAF, AAA-type ATPase, and DNA-binding Fis domains n=1 Tax=Desulfonatronum thiosulfatophilum TaxID=617002 RepID=A0A1G6BI36_9BACT|nr:sigma 54-interacting transcriptional regulator [Desulfonatronum thiosulfatophilum]SDB20266.1 Transcriptional regulator containing GAF, AAA-type ATPase, and DNA-binding Fis domains [Desulfonatronum thiosulfatophilum]
MKYSRSLKGTLLFAVAGLVVLSTLLTALLASHRYAQSLEQTLAAQTENVGRALAAEAADLVLVNDLVSLRNMLERQRNAHPALTYLFIVRDGRILASTFGIEMPADLLAFNLPEHLAGDEMSLHRIVTETGSRHLDMALPIFDGHAGILRLGVSEDHLRREVRNLWTSIGIVALLILIPALAGGLLFLNRMTRPLLALVQAAQNFAPGKAPDPLPLHGQKEIAVLAEAFNIMTRRIHEYTRRLEDQALELEQAQSQLRASCEIVRNVSALGSLREIGTYLIRRTKEIVHCGEVNLLVFNADRTMFFVISSEEIFEVFAPEAIASAEAQLHGMEPIFQPRTPLFDPPLISNTLKELPNQAILPLHHEDRLCGAMIIGCAVNLPFQHQDLELVSLVLAQASGTLRRAAQQEVESGKFQSRQDALPGFMGIIGRDAKLRQIFQLIEDVAATDATVLIQGESGTGKELVARAIHDLSPRKSNPFVVINCSAYPATLLESELFGHERGAFTGAQKQRPGRFEQANGGTVFLDEIGEISATAQVKLLRVLQTQRFERVGGDKTVDVDVRIVAATNKNLLEEVKAGNFREDLYYRLDVVPINLPPLRERGNDVVLLAGHFLRRFRSEQEKTVAEISPKAMRLLLDYSWPGNVRELENVIEQATVLAKSNVVTPEELPTRLRTALGPSSSASPTLEEQERIIIQEVLESCSWNKKLAAQRLGIGRSTLYAKIKRLGITVPEDA